MLPSKDYLLVLTNLMICCGTTFGNFFALAPNEFRPGWPLNISVTVHQHVTGHVFVNAILSPANDKIDVYTSVSDSISPGETKIITMQVPEIVLAPGSECLLTILATGAVTHSIEKLISYNPTSSLVFVETDKAIYKPGQKVHLRVVHVDKNLKPIIKPLTAVIVNPKDTKLEEYKNIASRTGVAEMTFELLQSASLGKWKIQVTDDAKMHYIKEFTVEEYVLPKFSVEVKSDPGFIVMKNSRPDSIVTVEALYTFGRAVQGSCTVTLSYRQIRGNDIVIRSTKQLNMSGKAEFSDLEWQKFIEAYNDWNRMIIIAASVTDETGRTEEGQATVNLFYYNLKVDILPKSTVVLRSGIPAELFVKVSDLAGNPVPNSDVSVSIKLNNMKAIQTKLSIPAGQTDISYQYTPERNPGQRGHVYGGSTGSITVSTVSGLATSLLTIYMYETDNDFVISVQPVQPDKIPQVGQQTEYKISKNSKGLQNTVGYMIISQGSIIDANSIIDDVIKITPTMEMCPHAKLLVFMGAGEQMTEVVVDAINISPSRCFAKEVDVTFKEAEIRTGVNTTMNIHVNRVDGSNAMPGAHNVYYLGIDKSLVLLQGSTDLNQDMVLSGFSNLSLKVINRFGKEYAPYSARTIIEFSGLIPFTTANLSSEHNYFTDEYPFPIPDGNFPLMAFDAGVMRKEMSLNTQEDTPKAKQQKNQQLQPVISKVRKHFPETWLWGHGRTDLNGHFEQTVTLPDTITTWLVSAFAVNDEGLVVGSNPFQLAAFQVFFLTMNLPYSIKRGEVFVLRITVFNYKKKDVSAVVKLASNNTQFSVIDWPDSNGWMQKDIAVDANRASSVEFKINATAVGMIELHVIAEDVEDGMRDEVKQKLLVKPEGEMRSRAITKVFLLKSATSLSNNVVINWPEDKIVPQSKKVEVKVTGNILGQSLSNLQRLVVLPYGCGEQNMMSTVPNIYGLSYIRSTDQMGTDDMERDMIKNMKTGYQRQVDMYRHSDGSYSAWGEKSYNSHFGDTVKPKGSTWLTAFVLKSFSRAAKFIHVDSEVMSSGAKFLADNQLRSGAFMETGQVFHTEMQSGTGSDSPLTVYVLISLLETDQALGGEKLNLRKHIDLALAYIKSNLSPRYMIEKKDKFLAAVTAYALSLLGDSLADDFLDVVTDLVAPWEDDGLLQKKVASDYWMRTSPSYNIEIAAYYLLTLIHRQRIGEGIEIIKWLQSQQNSLGGYRSTQDTIMALQALSEFGIVFKESPPVSLVNVQEPESGQSFNVSMEGSRAVLLHTVQLPDDTKVVEITATGPVNSFCVVKVVYTYYTLAGDDDMALSISEVSVVTKTSKLSDTVHKVEACVKSSKTLKYNGMFVLTLNLPSGEQALDDIPTILSKNPRAARVEADEGVIHFYMNQAPGDGYCLYAQLERQMEFEVQKPGSAKLYAYYEPDTASEVALALEDSLCTSKVCGSDGAVLLNMANVLLTIIICTLVSLLVCM